MRSAVSSKLVVSIRLTESICVLVLVPQFKIVVKVEIPIVLPGSITLAGDTSGRAVGVGMGVAVGVCALEIGTLTESAMTTKTSGTRMMGSLFIFRTTPRLHHGSHLLDGPPGQRDGQHGNRQVHGDIEIISHSLLFQGENPGQGDANVFTIT